jgi:hypothetical protein
MKGRIIPLALRTFAPVWLAITTWLTGCGRSGERREPPGASDVVVAQAPHVSVTESSPSPKVPGFAVVPATDDPTPDARAPAPSVAPATLSATWPQRIGQRVCFTSHVERALDLTQALIAARGEHFVVLLSPDQLWQGDGEQTFAVMGSKSVALHGHVTLPELVLETQDSAR